MKFTLVCKSYKREASANYIYTADIELADNFSFNFTRFLKDSTHFLLLRF